MWAMKPDEEGKAYKREKENKMRKHERMVNAFLCMTKCRGTENSVKGNT